jgi:hypothetical protein
VSKINLHNYEAYLLDLLDGNLSDETQVELELFLIQHPELNINLNDLPSLVITNETTVYNYKNNLKRNETNLVSDTQFVNYIENQLSQIERAEIEKSCLANPILQKELNLYKNTIVTPIEKVVFKNKALLKHTPKIIWFNFSATQYVAIAASVTFLVGLIILWPSNNSSTFTIANYGSTNSLINTPTIKEKQNNSAISPALLSKQNSQLANNTKTIKKKHGILNNAVVKNNDNLTETFDTTKQQFPLTDMGSNVAVLNNNTTILTPINKTEHDQTIVQTIIENDDQDVSIEKPNRNGIWAKAAKVLNNLNKIGVKNVNGAENSEKSNTAYALTVGGLNITHKPSEL